MELSADQLEWIVCEVVRRLRAAGAGDSGSSTASASGNQLALTEAVITAGQLADRISGVKQLRIDKRAVITPSARDLLKDRGIEIIRNT